METVQGINTNHSFSKYSTQGNLSSISVKDFMLTCTLRNGLVTADIFHIYTLMESYMVSSFCLITDMVFSSSVDQHT